MFEQMRKSVKSAETWLYMNRFHYQGDFRVRFSGGGHVDLRLLLGDFADEYFAELQHRLEAAEKLLLEALNVAPTSPVLKEAASSVQPEPRK